VESDAEIIDLELFRPRSAREIVEALNEQLPEGFKVLEGASLPWQSPSPSVSIKEVLYRVSLPPETPEDLDRRLEDFLAAGEVPVSRDKGGKRVNFDLRPDVIGLELADGALLLTMVKGSPTRLTEHLLGLTVEEARSLRIRKTAVVLG
jgi:radical SAM-linked protein